MGIAGGQIGEPQGFDPRQHQIEYIHRKNRWRVVERLGRQMGLIAQNRGHIGMHLRQEIVMDGHHGDPCRPEVFLGTGIDHADIAGIDGA